MVRYSHFLKNFPQFVVIHAVKGFGVVNKAEIDVFLEVSWFFDDPMDVVNLIILKENICWIIEKAWEFQKNIYFCFIDYAKAFDCVDHNKLCGSQ